MHNKQSASINEHPSHQTLSQNKKASSSSTKHSHGHQYNIAQSASSTNSGNLRPAKGMVTSQSIFQSQKGHQSRASLGHVHGSQGNVKQFVQSKKSSVTHKAQSSTTQVLAQKSEGEKSKTRGNLLHEYKKTTTNFHSRPLAATGVASGAASQLTAPIGLMAAAGNSFDPSTSSQQTKAYDMSGHSLGATGDPRQGLMAPQILLNSQGVNQQVKGVYMHQATDNFEMRSNSNDIHTHAGSSLDAQSLKGMAPNGKLQKSMIQHAAQQKLNQSSGNLNASRSSYCQSTQQQQFLQQQQRQFHQQDSAQRQAPTTAKHSQQMSKTQTTFLRDACAGLNTNQNTYSLHQQYASQHSQQKQVENMRHANENSRKNTLSQSDIQLQQQHENQVNIISQRHASKNTNSACSTSLDKYQQQVMPASNTNSSRIPQPSIINSATGNMNQMNTSKQQFPFNQSPRLSQPFNLVGSHGQQPSYSRDAGMNGSSVLAGFSSQQSGEKELHQSASGMLQVQNQLLLKVSGRKSEAFVQHNKLANPTSTTQSSNKLRVSSGGADSSAARARQLGVKSMAGGHLNQVLTQSSVLGSQHASKPSKMAFTEAVNQSTVGGRMVQKPMIINRQSSQCGTTAVASQSRRSLAHSKSGSSNHGNQVASQRQLHQRARDHNSKNSINLSLIKPQEDVMMNMHAKQMCSSTTSAGAVNSSTLAKFKQGEPRFSDINISQGAINPVDPTTGPSNLNLNVSVNQASGMMKRMRSSGNPNSAVNNVSLTQQQSSNSASGSQRYNQQRMTATGQNNRVKIDARLQNNENVKPTEQPGSNLMQQNSSFIGVNKYHDKHLVAHTRDRETGVIRNFKETKSGQNLNNNFMLSNGTMSKAHVAQTQRSTRVLNSSYQQNKAKAASINTSYYNNAGTSSVMSATHQGSMNKGGSAHFGIVSKQMSNKLLKEHQDKENKHKLANKSSALSSAAGQKAIINSKGSSTHAFNIAAVADSYEQAVHQPMKRTRTSETASRQSISNPVVPQQQKHPQPLQQKQVTMAQAQQAKSSCSGNKIMKSASSKGRGSSAHHSTDKLAVEALVNIASRDVSDHSRPMTTSGRGAIGRLSSSRQKKQIQGTSSQQKMDARMASSNLASKQKSGSIAVVQNQRLQQQIEATRIPAEGLLNIQTRQSTERHEQQRNLHTLQAELAPEVQVLSNRAPRQQMSEPIEVDLDQQQPDPIDSETSTQWHQSQHEAQPMGETHVIRAHQEEQKRQALSSRHTLMPAEDTQMQQAVVVDVSPLQQETEPEELKEQEDAEIEVEEAEEEAKMDVTAVMAERKRNWQRAYKTGLDLNDVLEIRNPQSVIEFVPEIIVNMQKEELGHMYPANFLHVSVQQEISERYRQYLIDWLAELHYKFKMKPETFFVTVGIVDKTLQRWPHFRKADLQCLGVTALHIAGKYEEIYPPDLRTILEVIDKAVTHSQVCHLEKDILEVLDFDMVWPSVLRFMQRYACVSNFSQDQHMIAQMFCDFMLYNVGLLKNRASLLGAVAIYATNRISHRSRPWNQSLIKATLGVKDHQLKPLVDELFYSVKKLEMDTMRTMFRKYEMQRYLGVIHVLQKIKLPPYLIQRLTHTYNNQSQSRGAGANAQAVTAAPAQIEQLQQPQDAQDPQQQQQAAQQQSQNQQQVVAGQTASAEDAQIDSSVQIEQED